MEKTISLTRLAKDAERVAREIESAGTMYRIKRPGGKSIVVSRDTSTRRGSRRRIRANR
jgi:hypothetical protein